jgi:hypothetical protein
MRTYRFYPEDEDYRFFKTLITPGRLDVVTNQRNII